MNRTYLDHAATTPVRREVLDAMLPLLGDGANPSAMYASARKARQILEAARKTIADIIGASAHEVFFTSGGTESDNWALLGWPGASQRRVITSAGEHHAVLDACRHLEELGTHVEYVPLNVDGTVNAREMLQALEEPADLVSIMLANNEVGTVNCLPVLSRAVHDAGAVFHTDAVAAMGKVQVRVEEQGVDLLSASAHKFYGPPGVGFLYVRESTGLQSILFGGAQERRRRPGTENVPGIHGMAVALELAEAERETESKRQFELTDILCSELALVPGIRINTPRSSCLPGTVHFLLPGIRSEAALIALDRGGFECGAGAACSRGAEGPSHVLIAMGMSPEDAACAVRVSIGKETTADDIHLFVKAVFDIVSLREVRK